MPEKSSDFARANDKANAARTPEKQAEAKSGGHLITPEGRGKLSHRLPTYVTEERTREAFRELLTMAPPGLWTKSDMPAAIQLSELHARTRAGEAIPAEHWTRYEKLLEQLGMTPKSRASMKTRKAPKAEDKPKSRFEGLRTIK
jgi:hypothetical protein